MQEPIQSSSSRPTTSSSKMAASSSKSPVSSSSAVIAAESGSENTASTSKQHFVQFPGINDNAQNTSANATTATTMSNGPSSSSSSHGPGGGASSAPNSMLLNSNSSSGNATAGPSTSPATRNPQQQQQQQQPYNNPSATPTPTSTSTSLPNTRLPRPSETFTRQLSNVLQHAFLPSVLPTAEEYQIKETARKFLQDLADRISPGAKLLPFGSQANGMALRNSDMDLCYIGSPGQPSRPASELVEMLGKLIEQEAPHFRVKMLSRARIPIIKIVMPKTQSSPYEISCDIGFENRLALENTRLLLTYAMVDPRLRVIVLFLKVWAKRRKINNPYLGTLSSYGYVLLVIHYLTNGRTPGVLPNLQRLQPPSPRAVGQAEFEGRDIYFFDDLDLLQLFWQSTNRDSVGELLIGFFNYYFKEFRYAFDVVSIRTEGGILSKAYKGWASDDKPEEYNAPRDFYRLCVEDPFQTDYNVARTVTVDGLFTIRREIARAAAILRGTRTDTSATALIAELVEEREDYLIQAPAPNTNRRRSAPSPRLQPTMLATQHDFRTWAMANGVPHAPGQTNIPIYSHQLQPNPLGDQHQQVEGDSVAQLHQLPNALHQQIHTTNAEAFARFQQASQALSQANLQQHQAIAAGQQHHTQQQQQFLANLPALLAASTLRNQRPSQPPRRFQQQQQQDNAYSRNFRQPQHLYQQQQYQHAQQANSSSIGSPTQLSPHTFLHPTSSNLSHMRGHSSQSSFSRSVNGYRADNAAPTLERRSSWDGGQANTEERAAYAGTSSISEAGGQSLPSGPATAPTSPATIGGNLPTFPRHGQSSNASTASTPSPSIATFQAYQNEINRQQRGGPGERYQAYNRQPHFSHQAGNFRGRSNRSRDGYASPSPPITAMPQPVPVSPTTLDASPSTNEPLTNEIQQDAPNASVTEPQTDTSKRPTEDLVVPVPDETSLEVEEALDPQSIRFGTFDAAFYSSEPAEMAGLGLFDGIPAFDSPAVSLPDQASDQGLPAPDELTLPAPLHSASSAPLPVIRRLGSNNRIATLRYRPGLADIPGSPAKRSTPASPDLSRRPSMHNRRKSAGDEAELALGDITFFGNVPVNKDENERIQAMNALLKEGAKASSLSGTPRKVRRTSTSSSTTNDSSSLLQLANPLPSSTSSSASLTSASTPASPSDTFHPESPPHLPPVEILLLSPSSRGAPIPMPDVSPSKPKSNSNASKASTKQGLSYASLAATPANSQSGKRRGRTGT